ncbi:MAG: hypothetical protein R3B40_11870 [Polyangiales bacterium]|nr:hypothetical protein [Myxococcales bacterium]MCB9657282.1 hypothetical protein [Sandaracinaceae bacterium]
MMVPYTLVRTPDVSVITEGAVVSYHAEPIGTPRTTVTAQGEVGSDWFMWVKWRLTGAEHEVLQVRPPSGHQRFDVTWDEDDGTYVVLCGVILNAAGSSNRTVDQWLAVSQIINTQQVILQTGRQMRRLAIVDPSAALPRTEMMLSVVEELASRTPPRGRKLRQHNDEVAEMRRYKSALANQLQSTDGKIRHGVRALYFATETQEARPLNVFVCRTNSGDGDQDWTLCDYTSPHTQLHSTHEVSAPNAHAAMRELVADWRSGFVSGNKYPPGRIQLEIPAAAIGGARFTHRMTTTGGTGLDALIEWLTWISTGAFGVALLLAPFPGTTAAAVALGTAMFSSTAAGTLSIAERRHRGLEWSLVDSVDLLGLMSDLLTIGRARQFRRGAEVHFLRPGRRTLERYVFWGHASVDVATAGATGYLIATQAYEELDRLANDPDLTGAERLHRMQQAMRRMGLQTVAIGLTLRDPGGGSSHTTTPSHLPNEGAHQSISDKLTALGDEASPPIRIGEGAPLEGTTQRTAGGRAEVTGRPAATAARPLRATWGTQSYPPDRRGGLYHGTHGRDFPDTREGQIAAAHRMLEQGLPGGSDNLDLQRHTATSLGDASGFRGAVEDRMAAGLWAVHDRARDYGVVVMLRERDAWNVRDVSRDAEHHGAPPYAGRAENEWAILRRVEPEDIIGVWVAYCNARGVVTLEQISLRAGR